MRDWRTTLCGVALMVVAAALVVFTNILASAEGKAIVTGMFMAGMGFVNARDSSSRPPDAK